MAEVMVTVEAVAVVVVMDVDTDDTLVAVMFHLKL